MARTVKSQQEKQALIFGVGFASRAIIPHLRQRGYHVAGTTRDGVSAIEMRGDGIEPIPFDGEVSADLMAAVRRADIILSSIPPGDEGDPVMQALPNLRAQAPRLTWAGYLSATSVYGDRQGQWAFEDELLMPMTRRGRARMRSELGWIESGLPVHVFRLAGIYGPGRSPFAKIREGAAKATVKPGHMVNRIHVDDIASAVMASIDRPDPVQVYNLADDEPAPPQDVLDYAAELIGAPRPLHIPLKTAEISDMARSFYTESKRVSNARAKSMLGWAPAYPSYREGLAAVLTAEGQDR